MTIHLSVEREELVRSLMEGGRFASEDEVIGEALRLLQERNEQAKLTELRREIAIGIEQADRGELEPFDPRVTLASVRSRRTVAKKEV
jgi:antitoxin ParD1/3/4